MSYCYSASSVYHCVGAWWICLIVTVRAQCIIVLEPDGCLIVTVRAQSIIVLEPDGYVLLLQCELSVSLCWSLMDVLLLQCELSLSLCWSLMDMSYCYSASSVYHCVWAWWICLIVAVYEVSLHVCVCCLCCSLMDVQMDVASSTGDGPLALNVEQCQCPTSYAGTSCERCAAGYYRQRSGAHLGVCVPCQCHGRASNCDPNTGECLVSHPLYPPPCPPPLRTLLTVSHQLRL